MLPYYKTQQVAKCHSFLKYFMDQHKNLGINQGKWLQQLKILNKEEK